MSIDTGNPVHLFAVCDQCGERRVLDLEPEADDAEVAEAIKAIGWVQRKPERVKFPSSSALRPETVTYPQDFCPDCQSDEERPRPRFGAGRRPVARLENDPCDEWPRLLIWEAAGLRLDCGHPRGPVGPCGYCALGLPLGHLR